MKNVVSMLIMLVCMPPAVSTAQNDVSRMLLKGRISRALNPYSARLWGHFSFNEEQQPIHVRLDSPTPGNVRDLVDKYPMIELVYITGSESGLLDEDFENVCVELARLDRLRSIDIVRAITMSDSACRSVSQLVQLEKLQLFLGDVSIEGIEHLAKLTKLKSLELRSQNPDHDGIAAAIIRRFPQLTEIRLSGDGIGPQSFEAVGRINPLKVLWLQYPINVDGEAFVHLLKCRQLQELWLRCDTRPDWYDTIARLGQLRLLDLGDPCTDRDLSKLAPLDQLEVLRIYGGSYSDQSLAKLKRLTQLKELKLSSKNVTGSAFRELGDLDQLKSLQLGHSKFAPENGPYLAELESLEYLNLEWTPLAWSNDWKSLAPLAKLKHLNKIWIDFDDNATHELMKRLPGVELNYYE